MDLVEPRMMLDACRVLQTLFWILLQEFGKKVAQIFAPILIEFRLSGEYFVIKKISVFGVEGRHAMYELIEDGAKTPPVHWFAVAYLLDDFGSEVLRGAAN